MPSRSTTDNPNVQNTLLKVMKVLASMPAQALYYGSALAAIWSAGGVDLPGSLGAVVAAVGMNALSNMLERVARGDEVPEEEIRKTIESTLQNLEIEKLATSNEFQRAIAHMFRQYDLIRYAIQKGEIELTRTLSEQFKKQGILLEELQVELAAVHDQTTEILDSVQQIAGTQKGQLESIQSIASSFLNFPTTLVDHKIESDLEVLRKSRFFIEFDRKDFPASFSRKLASGEFSGGTRSIRSRALAWCARILSEEPNKAEEVLDLAEELGNNIEIEIAYAFICSRKGGRGKALDILSVIDSPLARSAGFMIVTHHDGAERAVNWLKESGITIQDLDADGKYFLLAQLIELARWETALEYLDALSNEDLQEAPILNHMMAITHLVRAVPIELRESVIVHVPIEAAAFPLASDNVAIDARRLSQRYFNTAAEVAQQMNLSQASIFCTEYALWLELRDPDEHLSGRRKLEARIRESNHALSFINLGIQFGINLNPESIEQEIDRQLALRGGYKRDTAMARFALFYTKKTPEEAGDYISKYLDDLAKFLNKNFMLGLQIDLFLRAGKREKANECLDMLLQEGLSKDEENNIRLRISESEGNDAIDVRTEQFRKTNSIVDLANLIDELESRKGWNNLSIYSQMLFERTHSLRDAERFAFSLNHTQKYEQLVAFVRENKDLLVQSRRLQFLYCIALYYEGELLEARSELAKLDEDWADRNYRILQVNLRIAIGDWNSLLVIVANEFADRDKRTAQDLIYAAQLAANLDSSYAKDLTFAAVEKGSDDPYILVAAYFIASSAGWEDYPGVFSWIEKAAALSGDNGPIQQMTVKDVLDKKPEWDRRESETWSLLSRAEIPMFIAAQSLNKTLIDMMLFPALTNLTQSDPRRRGIVGAYSGGRQPKLVADHGVFGIDVTALLTLSFLNLVDKTLDMFEDVYLPHSTLLWLFEEKKKSLFHQPSRIKGARRFSQLLVSGAFERLIPTAVADSDLANQVGDELAQLIAEATKANLTDDVQRIVVRSSPVHRLTTLMDEEVDLTKYASILSGCKAIVDKLQLEGHLTKEDGKRANAYLQLQEKPWTNQPEISTGAILYLDDVTVSYFLHLGILEKLRTAGFRPIVSARKIAESNDLISFENISAKFGESIERIRSSISSRIQTGKVKIGRQYTFDDNAEAQSMRHPTLELIELAKTCDAIVADDRFLNQRSDLSNNETSALVFTTLDLLDKLVLGGVITSEDGLEYRTLLRRAGYLFVPVNSEDLLSQLTVSMIKGNHVMETAELRAIRENILRCRMSTWLQFPQEAIWLDAMTKAFYQTLKNLWEAENDLSEIIAKSDWIIDQIDVRGWAHRFGNETGENFVKTGRGLYILLLIMPPENLSADIQEAYLKWIDERILTSIKEQEPDLYSWIENWEKTHIARLTAKFINGDEEDYDG